MGTETIVNIAYECQIPQSIVKLNNPLMGTETAKTDKDILQLYVIQLN